MKICSWSSTTASEPDLLLIELVVRYQNDALKRRKKLFRNSLLGKNSLGSEQAPGFHHTLVQFSSVTQSCPTLCDPMNRSTPGLPVHHHLPEFTQTHIHRVSDAILPSHLRSSPSSPAPNPSSIRVFSNESTLRMRCPKNWTSASVLVLPMNIQDWSPLGWTGWISLQSKGLSRVFSNTTVQKHQLFSAQHSSQSNSHIHTWLLEKP